MSIVNRLMEASGCEVIRKLSPPEADERTFLRRSDAPLKIKIDAESGYAW
jgi:hypothetical protein